MRPVYSTTDTALSNPITQPYYLVYIAFTTPVYLSSTAHDVTYNGNVYTAANMEVDLSGPMIEIFNANTTIGQTVFTDGVAGRSISIYRGDRKDPTRIYPAFEGEGGSATIDEYVEIRCNAAKPSRTPRHYCAPPVFNHLLPPGTRWETPNGTVILDG